MFSPTITPLHRASLRNLISRSFAYTLLIRPNINCLTLTFCLPAHDEQTTSNFFFFSHSHLHICSYMTLLQVTSSLIWSVLTFLTSKCQLNELTIHGESEDQLEIADREKKKYFPPPFVCCLFFKL